MDFSTYDPDDFAAELAAAESNREVATTLLFENDRVRVWELALDPGRRAPFHCHTNPYFFVCVDAGRALTRLPDGNAVTVDYEVGGTWFTDLEDGPEIHDLENVGDTRLRFTTVELLE